MMVRRHRQPKERRMSADEYSLAETPAVLAPPVNEALLAEIVRRIAGHLANPCIVLFGSHAYGRPGARSDLDLLVIADTQKGTFTVAGELYGVLRPRRFAMDIVVLTPEMYRRRRAGFDPFLEEVGRKGRVLYGQLP